MTIVELFDEKPINNVVGAIAFHPEKIIYVGILSQKHFEKRKLPVLRNYLDKKQLSDIEIEYVQVRRDSLLDIVEHFEQIYQANRECRFHVEVTGGEDLVLIALGIVCQRHPDIELYQSTSKLRSIRSFSLGSEDSEDGEKVEVACINSVEDNLLLHGASIVTANGEDMIPCGFRWGIEFMQDVNEMWRLCCHGLNRWVAYSSPNLWNRVTGALAELDAAFEDRPDKNVIKIDKHYYNNVFLGDRNAELFHDYIFSLAVNGLMNYRTDENYVYLTFKNDQVRMCLTKEGLILELKTYMLCLELVHQRGGDCMTGVTIDWDGEDDLISTIKYLYDPDDPDSTIDTLNEVDVIATCGMVPYFISCKNGRFTSEELYKLYSVGEQFGRGYCKKIIVTTNLTYALGNAKNLLLQRAADMGIIIIENVHRKTDDEFREELQKVMELPKIKEYSTI